VALIWGGYKGDMEQWISCLDKPEEPGMDLFLIQLDGLDVAMTDSEMAAIDHAQRLAAHDPTVTVRIVRVDGTSIEVLPRFPVAEAATA
jgi:hypothetical protein